MCCQSQEKGISNLNKCFLEEFYEINHYHKSIEEQEVLQ